MIVPELVPIAIARYLSLVSWIGEHPGVTVDDVAEHFGRSKRQIMRDIEALGTVGDSLPGSSFEIDWELYEMQKRLSIRSTLGADFPPSFSASEATAILVGLQALSDVLDDDLRAHLPHTAMAVRSLASRTPDAPVVVHSGAVHPDERLDALRTAIGSKRCVSFTYTSPSGTSSARVVEPWNVALASSGWILTGWCRTASQQRTFRVDRMNSLAIEDKPTTTPRPAQADEEKTWTRIVLGPGGQWAIDEYDAREAVHHDDGTVSAILPVWNEEWLACLLIDVAPTLIDVDEGARARAGEQARRILSAWNTYFEEHS